MKNIRFLFVLLLAAMSLSIFAPAGALALEDPSLSAKSVVLVDTKTGAILYEKDKNTRVDPASITKIMTVMLAVEAIERGDLSAGEMVTATETAANGLTEDSSTANITSGETMSLMNLLYCAMLGSANEACNIIAEYIGGSISSFVEQMNARAAELGCTGTRFANPHGMPDKNHYSTAWDLYLIAQAATSMSLFSEICGTSYIEVPETNSHEVRKLINTNMLLNTSSEYYYKYAGGVKTGYTNAAGNCLVSTATKDDISLLAVVMGSAHKNSKDEDDPQHFADTIALYSWAFDNFSYREVLRSTEIITEVPISMASETDHVALRPENSVMVLLPNDDNLTTFENQTLVYAERDGEKLQAPIPAGKVLGEISVVNNGQVYGKAMLVAANSVDLSKLSFIKSEIYKTWKKPVVQIVFWLIILLAIGYIVLVARYRMNRRRHRQSVRAAQKLREKQRLQDQRGREPEFVDYQFDRQGGDGRVSDRDSSEWPDYIENLVGDASEKYDEPERDSQTSSSRGFFNDFLDK